MSPEFAIVLSFVAIPAFIAFLGYAMYNEVWPFEPKVNYSKKNFGAKNYVYPQRKV